MTHFTPRPWKKPTLLAILLLALGFIGFRGYSFFQKNLPYERAYADAIGSTNTPPNGPGLTVTLTNADGKPIDTRDTTVLIGAYGYSDFVPIRNSRFAPFKSNAPSPIIPGKTYPFLVMKGLACHQADFTAAANSTLLTITESSLLPHPALPDIDTEISGPATGPITYSIRNVAKTPLTFRVSDLVIYTPFEGLVSLSPSFVATQGKPASADPVTLQPGDPAIVFEINWQTALKSGRWLPYPYHSGSWPIPTEKLPLGQTWFRVSLHGNSSLPIALTTTPAKSNP